MCRVLYVVGAVLLTAVCLQAQPVILSQPTSVTVNNASAAAFAVAATNAIAYQWFENGTSLDGATNSTLSLDNVNSTEAGTYTVVITSADGLSVTSAPAVLTLVPGTIVNWTISTFPDGSSSTFQVQLFDHDKPATVENFIHYITSGAYSNTFFDRDAVGFVLQGGDYVLSNRTDAELTGGPVPVGPTFPSQVDSEFNVGPLIHNTFGTLAMALQPDNPNSATSAFFFNLADNSANLDYQDGGFTVFGRILSGSNTLQYFNTLSAPVDGIYNYEPGITNLPVNYDGAAVPGCSNVFFCDFSFSNGPPVDVTPPTLTITSPPPAAELTNGALVIKGTAQDNVGLAEVFYVLTTQDGGSQTNTADGTTNWSANLSGLAPGVYTFTAFAQDGAGNLSPGASQSFTNLALLTFITNFDGDFTTNGEYVEPGELFSLNAAAPPGEVFIDWQDGSAASFDPLFTFTSDSNVTLTVTYINGTLPLGLSVTNPPDGSVAQAANGVLQINGSLPESTLVTQVTCQLFFDSNTVSAPLPAQIDGNSWSLAVTNTAPGPYVLLVIAQDAAGDEGELLESFSVTVSPPAITAQPTSVTVNAGSSAYFTVAASNALAYQWYLAGSGPILGQLGSTLELDDVSNSQSGSQYYAVVTSADGETATSAMAALTVVQGTIVDLTVANFPGGGSNMVLELFDHDKPATVANFIHYITSGAYSNVFFDWDTNEILQAGDYTTVDQTGNSLQGGPTSTGTNIFPMQVDNEYDTGTAIGNTFGTIAMALEQGLPNSAHDAFFFNLADNSYPLDYENGGYTVFGRVISGTNVLHYFTTLTGGNGIVSADGFEALPVNYDGTQAPTDASLFYCDFSIPTPPPPDTTPPTITVTSTVLANQTLTVQGVAQDNVGLAEIFGVLTSTTGAYNDQPQTNAAQGTTNWTLALGALPPGLYNLALYAQDGSGNLSAPALETVTNYAVVTIVTNIGGQQFTGPSQYFLPGQSFSATAATLTGATFLGWTLNGITSLNPTETFSVTGSTTVTISYLGADPSLAVAITAPVAGQQAYSIQSVLAVSGTVASTNVASVACQIFSGSVSLGNPLNAILNGTNWSLSINDLPNGTYTIVAVATDPEGLGSTASSTFTVLNVEQFNVQIIGAGTVAGNPGPYAVPGNYTLTAKPARGSVFYTWNNGGVLSSSAAQTLTVNSNVNLTVTFLPDTFSTKGITFTYPPANGRLTNGTFALAGKLPSSLAVTQMTCQLFLQSTGVTPPQPVTTDSTGEKWTLPVAGLAPGSYKALALAYDSAGNPRLVSENFNLLTKLTVNVQPPQAGSVTAGLNGKYFEVGQSIAVTATAKRGQLFAYWSGPVASGESPSTTAQISANTVLTANFVTNPFPAVAGTYTGLFFNPAHISPTNAGFIRITTTASGGFSGKVVFPGRTYPINYRFPYYGWTILPGRGFDNNPLLLALALDLTNGTGTISGFISDQPANGPSIWSNSVVLFRSANDLSGTNAAAPGNYINLLQQENSTNDTPAFGYQALALGDKGTLTLTGTLPDGAAYSGSAALSKEGIWPCFVQPAAYPKTGMLIGWQSLTASGSTGQLYWLSPSDGTAASLSATGGPVAPPAANTQYDFVVPGDTTVTVTVNAEHKFVASSPFVNIALSPSGILTGTIKLVAGSASFKGAFINPSLGGGALIWEGGKAGTEGFKILPQSQP